ncbi:acyl-CoA thioesterase [Paraglaciecola psychrophila]|uniref:acyl-CoA thioesterase n=1 Tax=Paraglaciecola psychrophila TaxID=326544 RepID=UPI0002919569|nr:thioesterase family protein [Paraglaciecola psychrophila]GAC36412.1 acyl-CoA thioester hydrolase [Paraglaciecola psychrophila 170]
MQMITQKNTQNTTQLNTSLVKEQFTILLRVRYGECDAQQVVFNARYADYIDIAMTEYFRAALGGFQVLLNKGLDSQVVSLHIDWESSAKFDDVLALEVKTKKVGNTSYGFEVLITDFTSQIQIAKSTVTYVMVDTQTYQKTPIPDWLRERLLTATPFPLINHAGVLA